MSSENRKSVKIREELIGPLAHWVRYTGGREIDAATFGTWMYLALPELLQRRLRSVYFEWCKTPTMDCYVPTGCDRFVDAVIAVIRREVDAEHRRLEKEHGPAITLSEMLDLPPEIKQADAAAKRALEEDGGGRSTAPQGKDGGKGPSCARCLPARRPSPSS